MKPHAQKSPLLSRMNAKRNYPPEKSRSYARRLSLEGLEDRSLPSSYAIKVESGSTSFIVQDGGPGDLDGAVNNQILVQSGIGVPAVPGFRILAASSLTNAPGNSSGALLQTNFTVFATGTGGGAVTISASATGFDQPPGTLNPLSLV